MNLKKKLNNASHYLRNNQVGWRNIILILILGMLLQFPDIYLIYREGYFTDIITHFVLDSTCLLIPLVLFSWNIKIYLYILSFFAFLVPTVFFSMYFFNVHDMLITESLIFQTNFQEASELASGFTVPFIIITLLYGIVYLAIVKTISIRRIPFLWGLLISLIALAVFFQRVNSKQKRATLPTVVALNAYYPLSVVNSAWYILRNNRYNSRKVNSFSFHAHRKDSISKKKVFVFIIGEASNYYHWQINGYSRPTSPRLLSQKDLNVYTDAAAGAHTTMLSVPQMITRARPGNSQAEYEERGIMSAFKEAGFKTYWFSNQEPDYWVRSIVAHAMESDFDVFPNSKLLDQKSLYDGRFLPLIDSVIQHEDKDQFIVFHTLGSHWNYSERYPENFDYFKPSGIGASVYKISAKDRQTVINSYDNSIRYTDFIIDSVIRMVKKYNCISYVLYISDHGEDVFEVNKNKWQSHGIASKYTLHVPLFIWTSPQYDQVFPYKREELAQKKNDKIGGNDIFYTLLDMADVTYPGFDSTRSLSSGAFRESKQRYYESNTELTHYYSQLKQ